jgi:hypothetical protein
VCTDTASLKTSITDIGTAVTAGGADVQNAIAQQFVLIQESASALLTTVSSIPASDSSSPDATAIQESSTNLNTAVESLGTSITELKDASGLGIGVALLSVGTAVGNASQAALDSVQAIDTAINNRTAAIGQAFDASPSCDGLTAEKQ